MKQNNRNTVARCPIPPNRYDKEVQTPSHWAEVKKPDCVDIDLRMKTTAADACVSRDDKVEPSRYQETAVAAVGAGTGGTKIVKDQLMDSNKHRTAARTLPSNCGEIVKPMSGLVQPVITKMAPTDGMGVMHYECYALVASQSTYKQPVLISLVTDDRGNASTGPVGHDLFLADKGETVDRRVLVGPHNGTEQSVFLGLDVERVEHSGP